MVAQLIDLSNYDTCLKLSTASRSGTPDGNIFFDVTGGTVELITREELAQINFTGSPEDNPLTNQTGITCGALYAFERKMRRTNETLRKYDFFAKGTFKFAGAYELVNGRKYAGTDRVKIRASGWIERALNGAVDRIYFGVRSLGNIEDTSQPYYQLELGGAPVNFAKPGSIDEAVQVFGTTANGDTGAGDFDKRTYLSNKVRTFGFNYDEKKLVDSGVSEMGGYSTGFAVGESPHLTTGDYALVDVYGGAKISPWTGMTLEKLATAQVEGGFNEDDGDFTWILHNTLNGNLSQCVAFLDALAQTDDDIDSGSLTVTKGKRVGTWYSYDAQGRIVTRSGADTKGLFIENLPVADQQKVVFTDDVGDTKTYPFYVALTISVGANAVADANAWFHVWKAAGYGTDAAETVLDADDAPMKGSVGGVSPIVCTYDFDEVGGGELAIIVEVEGDGGATQAKTAATITRIPIVTVACEPGLETNV